MKLESQKGYGELESGEIITEEGWCDINHEGFDCGEGSREGLVKKKGVVVGEEECDLFSAKCSRNDNSAAKSGQNCEMPPKKLKQGELAIELQLDQGNPPTNDQRNNPLTHQHKRKETVRTSIMGHGDVNMDGTNHMCLGSSYGKRLEDQGSEDFELECFLVNDDLKNDQNDDICIICGDYGNLLCCDGCPSAFHQSCLDIQEVPPGDWYCNSCHCKFCGLSTKIMQPFVLLTCRSCQQRYHKSCHDSNGDSRYAFLCGSRCEELFKRLNMLLGVRHEIIDGLSWSFVRWSDVNASPSQPTPKRIKMIECNSKVDAALSIMKPCFEKMIDDKSDTEIIPSILYNRRSNLPRINYEGFITVILEKGDAIISVASIRIHGNELAEMPFIATDSLYRNQGMCHKLLNCIEMALSYLNVDILIIPSIPEVTKTWISRFGFERIDLTINNLMKNKNIVSFPGSDKLYKRIPKHNFWDENVSSTRGIS